jgi:hypothetical protein
MGSGMCWLRAMIGRPAPPGRHRVPSDGGLDAGGPPFAAALDDDMDADEPVACSLCGRPFGFDWEDDRDGAGHGRPLCGECVRNVNFDPDFGG